MYKMNKETASSKEVETVEAPWFYQYGEYEIKKELGGWQVYNWKGGWLAESETLNDAVEYINKWLSN